MTATTVSEAVQFGLEGMPADVLDAPPGAFIPEEPNTAYPLRQALLEAANMPLDAPGSDAAPAPVDAPATDAAMDGGAGAPTAKSRARSPRRLLPTDGDRAASPGAERAGLRKKQRKGEKKTKAQRIQELEEQKKRSKEERLMEGEGEGTPG